MPALSVPPIPRGACHHADGAVVRSAARRIWSPRYETALVEMGRKQLSESSLASIGKIALGRIRTGRLLEAEDDFGRLGVAIGKLTNAKLIIDDRAALSVAQMRSQCRRVVRQHGLSTTDRKSVV